MALTCGIVGLPNVGKSTLFNALTRAGAAVENYPFCTIDPNSGIVEVPDERMNRIEEYIPTQSKIPATVEFVDIAGLVKGASQGEGLGNQFLGHIRNVSVIVHVVRCFENSDIHHVDGNIDPLRDIETIENELIISDLDLVERRKESLVKQIRSGNKEAKIESDHLEVIEKILSDGQPARNADLSEDDWNALTGAPLITAKKIVYCCNVSDDEAATGNEHVEKVRQYAESQGAECLHLSAAIEAEISELEDDAERQEFLESLELKNSGLEQLSQKAYHLLGLHTYFTAGEKEIRAWTIKENTLAPQAAGVIHTDFERGFIRAEVYHFDDLMELKSEKAIKEAGKLRVEGKEYIMKDGDICHFLFNV